METCCLLMEFLPVSTHEPMAMVVQMAVLVCYWKLLNPTKSGGSPNFLVFISTIFSYLCYINARNVNHCGRGVSLTSPNGASHQRLLSSMFRSSGIDKDSVDYWEAHGTGTSRGDPIEFNALSSVLNDMSIGSVKSSLGHSEAAAGVTGLLKLCLLLQHQFIPPQLHLQLLNREISPGSLYLPFVGEEEGIQLGGISSFGVSGTNAAAILRKTNHDKEIWKEHRPIHKLYLLPLSAKSQSSLAEMEKNILSMLQTSDASISKVAATLANCRKHFNHRTALVVSRSGQIISRSTVIVKENKAKKRIKLSVNNSNTHPDILSIEMIQKTFMKSDYQDVDSDMTSKLSHSFTGFIKQLCGEIHISTVPSENLKLDENSLGLQKYLNSDRQDDSFSIELISLETLFEIVSHLYLHDYPINWSLIYAPPSIPTLLPNYPFSKQSYWFSNREEVFDHYLVGTRIKAG